jgi:hypothetical protein
MLSYKNKHGEAVRVLVSGHARQRFQERWEKTFPDVPLEDVDVVLARWFSTASRVQNLSERDRKRMRKYGKDTLFFRTNVFTFVVSNSVLVTVEISDRGSRHQNKG